MSQINSNNKDDFQVVLLLSCFVGHSVCIFWIYLFISFLIECGKLVDTVITRKQCKYFTSNLVKLKMKRVYVQCKIAMSNVH